MSKNSIYSSVANSSDLVNKRTAYINPYAGGLMFFYALIIITSLIAYGFIILTVYFDRRLRTICNYFIVSLGVADAMIVTMVMPVNISLLQGTFRFHSAAHCRFIATVNLISEYGEIFCHRTSVQIRGFYYDKNNCSGSRRRLVLRCSGGATPNTGLAFPAYFSPWKGMLG